MPNAIVIPLQRTNDAPLPAAVGEYTHAAFFALLRQADPELAARLHANPERKPFTLSAVQEERRERPCAGQNARLRVTFLDDSLFPLFAGALLRGGLQEGLRIGQARFLLTGLLTTEGSHPQAGHAAYTELLERTQGVQTVAIHFASPTLFRSQGQDVLWPAPRYVWQSWLRAWNSYAGVECGVSGVDVRGENTRTAVAADADASEGMLDEARLVELAGTQVTVERYHLKTCHVTLSEGGMNGFLGTCVYGLKALSEADRRIFVLLADYAFYAGTGRKTAMGLGQTVRMK
jgi:CRISPR-associated endoribonuclease Cas6